MPKGRTIRIRALVKERRQQRLAGVNPHKTEHWRPKTRADCDTVPRPCPYVGCRHHLFLDVGPSGSIQFPHGDSLASLDAMPVSCALDAADAGPSEVGEVGQLVGMSPWWSGQTIAKALAAMGEMRVARELAE